MKKLTLIIFSIITVCFLGFIGIVKYSLDNEKFHQSPCEASASLLIDSLKQEYNIPIWSNHPKNFCSKCEDYDSTKVNCKILICNLRIDEPKIDFQQDSIIQQIMFKFWSFQQNQNVDSLYLTIENNKKKVSCYLSKLSLNKKHTAFIYDSIYSETDVEIMQKINAKEFGGGGNYEKYEILTREVIVISKVDLFNFQELADKLYESELSNCKENNIATLTIRIKTEAPKGQFTKEKVNKFRYEIIPFNEYNKKKNALQH